MCRLPLLFFTFRLLILFTTIHVILYRVDGNVSQINKPRFLFLFSPRSLTKHVGRRTIKLITSHGKSLFYIKFETSSLSLSLSSLCGTDRDFWRLQIYTCINPMPVRYYLPLKQLIAMSLNTNNTPNRKSSLLLIFYQTKWKIAIIYICSFLPFLLSIVIFFKLSFFDRHTNQCFWCLFRTQLTLLVWMLALVVWLVFHILNVIRYPSLRQRSQLLYCTVLYVLYCSVL